MHSRSLRWACAIALFACTAPVYAQLIRPPLGDLQYAQMKDELIGRIPEYAPGWTDTNPGDPGVTLLELFAFLADDLSFRVAVDLPNLLWSDYQPDDEASLGSLAFVLLDAGYQLRFGGDLEAKDALQSLGLDPRWTYAELVAAARAIPEPGTLGLIVAGYLVLTFNLFGRRTAQNL